MKTETLKTMNNKFRIALGMAAISLLLAAQATFAQTTDTWQGNTDANWSTSGNWSYSVGSGPVANGDSLVFDVMGSAGSSLLNDISSLSVNGLTINSGASAYTFAGNSLTLTGPLVNNAANNVTISLILGGAGSVTNAGSGTLTLSGANTFTGGTTISAGTVAYSANNNLGASASTVTLNGGTLQMLNSTAMTGTHTNTIGASGGAINIAGAAGSGQGSRVVFNTANTILGAGNLSVTGTGALAPAGGQGVLVLGGANSYSGSLTLLNGGFIEYGFAGALGSPVITLGDNGGISAVSGINVTNEITVNGTNSVISFNNGVAGVFSGAVTMNTNTTIGLRDWYNYGVARNGQLTGVVSGPGRLLVNSGTTTGGILNLGGFSSGGMNTYSGGTEVTNALVLLGVTNWNGVAANGAGNSYVVNQLAALGAGAVQIDTNAAIQLGYRCANTGVITPPYAVSNNVTLNGGAIWANDGYQHVTGPINVTSLGGYMGSTYSAGSPNWNKGLFVDGVVSGSGPLTLEQAGSGGNGAVPEANGWNNASGNSYNVSIVMFTNAANTYSGTINVTGSATTGHCSYLGVNANTALQYAAININGTNTGGGNTWGTGPLLFQAGLGSDAFTLGAISGSASFALTEVNEGTLAAGNPVALTVGGNNTSTTYAGVMSGVGSLIKAGSGTFTLTGANTYTGTTTVSAGALTIGGAGQLGSGYYAGAIVNNSSLNYDSSASQILAGPVSGSGTLTVYGTRTLTFGGMNSSTVNNVTVNDGATLIGAFASSAQLAPTSMTVGNTTGATLGFVANSTSVAEMAPGTLTVNGTATLKIVGGNFVVGSSYPLIASASISSLSGYSLGTLPSGVGGNLTLMGNTIYFHVTGLTNTVWTGVANGTWDINTTANWTNAATLGTTYVDGSPVQFDDTGTNTTTISNSVATTLSPLSVLVTNNVKNYAFTANTIIAGAASLTKTGTANLTNSTPNTYTGPTVINQGQLVVGVASVANVSGALGNNSAVTLGNDSTAVLNLNNLATQVGSLTGGGAAGGNVTLGSATLTVGADNSSTTYAGIVGGTGGLSKIGTGTLTLSATNTFTGAWSVNAGTLNYNGSLASSGVLTVNGNGANSIVNIGSGATLGLNNNSHMLVGNNGTAAGAVYQSGGNISTNASSYAQLQVGSGANAYGYYNLSGGTLAICELDCGGFNGAPTGVFDMIGGTVTDSVWFIIARGAGGPSILNLMGGTYNFTGTAANQLLMHYNANATQSAILNIANASFYATNATAGILNMMRSGSAGQFAAVNLLSGGVMQVQGVNAGNTTGTSHFNFNGGTLKAFTANTAFLTANVSMANVYSGGGIVDNNGVNITIPAALAAPAGSGLNGSVTLNNGGSGYIGAPAVTFSGGGGTGATAYATISGGAVTGVVITSPGVNYSSTPTVVFTGGGGSGAAATAPTPTANTSGGMTFQGSGTTTLTGVNTYTGGTKVLGGTLAINIATGGAQGGGNLVVSNAALNVNASGGTALSGGNLTLQGTNVLSFSPNPSAANSSSTCINLSGTLSNTGTNNITVSGIGLSVGVYHLITAASGSVSTNNFVLAGLPLGAQGVLTNSTPTTLDFVVTSIGQVLSWVGNGNSTPAPWDIGISAEWYDPSQNLTTYNQYFTNTMGDLVFFGQDGANTTDTNFVNLVTNVVPAAVTFNWVYPYVLTGSGSIGGITSLVVTDAPSVFLGTSNSYTGGTFVYGGSLAITNDDALGAISKGVTLGSDASGSGTLQLNGVTSARNISLVGNSAIGVASNMASVVSGNITGTGTLTKSDYGTLTLSGVVSNTGSLDFLTGTGAISGMVSIGGELWAGASSDSNSFGVLNIQPGANVTVPSWIAIGRGDYGILNMNGGTLTKGGDNSTHLTMAGAGSGETGILNLNGGLIQDATGDCWLGERFTAIVNQNGGTLANIGGSVYLGVAATADSTYNLNGGLLQTRSIIVGNSGAVSNAVFNFNGGTLQAAASSSAFMQGLTAVYVTANGAIIDTTNFNITIPQALTDDPIHGNGSLVKLGMGVLTLSGSNTISGPIAVNQGTLLVTPVEQGSNVVTVASGAAYGVQLTGGPGTVTNTSVTLNSGSTTLTFSLGTNGNPGLPMLVCALTNNGTLNVAVGANSTLLTVGSAIPLVHYTGGVLGTLNSTIAGPRGSSMTLSNDATGQTLYAVVNSFIGGIVWTGTNTAPGLANLWDLNSTTNWLIAGSPTDYQETLPPGDAVTFNDLGSGMVLLSNTASPASVIISNNAVNYTFQGTGQINSAGGLAKLGTGTATLNLRGTYSVSTVVSNGTLSLGTNQTFANLTGNGTISTASGSPTLTVDSSANTTFSGTLQNGLGLTKIGTGTLTLTGPNTASGINSINGGTVVVTDNGAINATTNTSARVLVGGVSGASGAMYQNGANTVVCVGNAGGFGQIGSVAGASGYYNLSAGSFVIPNNGEMDPGGSGGGAGTFGQFDMSGGTVLVGDTNVTTASYFLPNRGASGESSVVNISGGTFLINSRMTESATFGGFEINWGAGRQTNATTISGNAFFSSPSESVKLNQSNNSSNVCSLNLNGGTFQTLGFTAGHCTNATVNFNGGTLMAGSSANANFMGGAGQVYIYSGGAIIDDNGKAIDPGQPLLTPVGNGVSSIAVSTGGAGYITPPQVMISDSTGSGATAYAVLSGGAVSGIVVTCPGNNYSSATVTLAGGGYTTAATLGAVSLAANTSGGLTKLGTNTLTLSSANTYTGNTVVSNGTLLVNGSISTGTTTVNGGTLGGIGTLGGALLNKATLFPGSNGIGTLTVNGNITLNAGSTNTFNVNGSTHTNNAVAAGGAVSYGGLLNIVPAGTFTVGQQFQLFSGAGAASASNFASIAGSPGAGLAFSFTNGVLSVVAGGPVLTLTNVTPASVPGSSYSVTIDLFGTGFSGASSVLLTNGATQVSSTTTFVDAGHLKATFVPGPAASSWTATVADSGNYTASLPFSVTVPTGVTIGKSSLTSAGAGKLVLSGSGGTAGYSYAVLSTTNLNPPVVWMPIVTNMFDGSGNFAYTNTISTATNKLFLRIEQ